MRKTSSHSATRSLATFLAIFAALVLLHLPLLRLPYYWDEAGYYVPAARDLLLDGSLIPHTTLTNAHPPLLMAWLALCWKVFGFAPLVTRATMLAVAAFALTGLFRLAAQVSNATVAAATTGLTAVYPVFFAQSSLAHVDVAAAALTFWGLHAYFEERIPLASFWLALAALAKETAVLAPLALILWEVVGPRFVRREAQARWLFFPACNHRRVACLLAATVPLLCWFAYHYHRTGIIFGNPEFFRYNVQSTLHPLRIVLALAGRLWQAIGYLHLYFLTLLMAAAMFLQPRQGEKEALPRIALPVQVTLAIVMLAYVLALSVIGGALLARYMLPVVPLTILFGVSTIWRRVSYWPRVLALIAVLFAVGWFWNPPYGFAFEDNLAYHDYVELHQSAADYVQSHYAHGSILTAWTASDELTRPFLGYVQKPVRVVRIENFSVEELLGAAQGPVAYDAALVFSTKYEPRFDLMRDPLWIRLKTRFFGYHHDLPPPVAARILNGHIVYERHRGMQWIAVIAIDRPVEARAPSPRPHQVTGVGLDDKPHLAVRLKGQGVPGRQSEMHFQFDTAIDARNHYHIPPDQRRNPPTDDIARAEAPWLLRG